MAKTVPPPRPEAPPAPKTAMNRMRDKLEEFQRKAPAQPQTRTEKEVHEPKPETQLEPPKPDTEEQLEGMDDSDPAKEGAEPKATDATTDRPPTDPAKKEKVSPWRLVDQWKGRAAELEKQLAEFKTNGKSPDVAKTYEEKIQKYEARMKEMEDKLVLTDYRQSQAFKDTYEKPYFDAYSSARQRVASMKTDVGEMATAETFDHIMQQPDDDSAAAAIEELFGTGVKASTVTQLREKVLDLSRKATTHLKEQTEAGAAKLKEFQEQSEKVQSQIKEHITKTWDAANKALLEDPKIGDMFKQREGDPEWNQRLAKGFELTDRAFAENASDPNLTPEQRAGIVKRHAAVRNRAAAFGALRFEVSRLQQQLAAANKELSDYRGSEPGGGEGKGKTADVTPAKPWDRLRDELRRRAK